jgi:hypothetical protein
MLGNVDQAASVWSAMSAGIPVNAVAAALNQNNVGISSGLALSSYCTAEIIADSTTCVEFGLAE